MDDTEFKDWSAVSRKWTWSQINETGITGPRIFELDKWEHTVTSSSPMAAAPGHAHGGCNLDAIYITSNLSLRADQIQRRFELTMGYVEEAAAIGLRETGKAIATWAGIKDDTPGSEIYR